MSTTANLFKFPMPDIGEGVAEGEIVEWMVVAGADVKEDDVLFEVMTDKATVEITSPLDGKVVSSLEFLFLRQGSTSAPTVGFHASFTDGSSGIFVTPEPSTVLLLGLGLAGLALGRKRLK